MAIRRPWPEAPPIEDELALQRHLEGICADEETRAFCRDLAQDGLARIDLGEEGRALCDAVVAETDPRFDERGAKRLQDAWLRSSSVRRLATFAKVERLLRAAYGRPPFAFQTLNFRVGSQQHVHSDAIHFHSAPERFMCGVWTALEDISEESGPLVYYAGSHKLPILTMRGAGVNHKGPSVEEYGALWVPALQARLDGAGLQRRTATPRKGEALVWAANLAHGGAPISDPASTRRSLVTHFFFKDCLYYTPMVSDVEEGRLDVRLPLNVDRFSVEWPKLNGRPARVAPKHLIDSGWRLLFRQPHVS
jgi:hypothetical protein